jgi:YVTN family beta-propeller protein
MPYRWVYVGLVFGVTLLSQLGGAESAYVARAGAGILTVVSVASSAITGTVTVETTPAALAKTPDGTKVYTLTPGAVKVVNTATDTVSATINVGANSQAVIFTPNGSKAYVANAGSGTVSVINVGSSSVSTTVTVGSSPQDLVVLPNGSKVYVANSGEDSVSVITTSSDTVTATVSGLTGFPSILTVTPDGSKVYVGSSDGTPDAFIGVIATSGDTLSSTIPLGSGSINQVGVNSDGQYLYVTSPDGSSLFIITTSDDTVSTTLAIENSPGAFIFDSPSPAPSATSTLSAKTFKKRFFSQTDLVNRISWTSPDDVTVSQYRLYRNADQTDLVGTTPPHIVHLDDHTRRRGQANAYYLTYLDENDTEFSLGSIVVTP